MWSNTVSIVDHKLGYFVSFVILDFHSKGIPNYQLKHIQETREMEKWR